MSEKKKVSRKEQREEIIKILYRLDINKELIDLQDESEYVKESAEGVIAHIHKIDELLTDNLVNWKINRLSYVDRAIMRFAVYEMYYTNTPVEIVINEALNLTRKYTDEGDDKTVSFTNKVLDNVYKSIKKLG
jgi:N utilization substance protein B